jgi:hypothetical protein
MKTLSLFLMAAALPLAAADSVALSSLVEALGKAPETPQPTVQPTVSGPISITPGAGTVGPLQARLAPRAALVTPNMLMESLLDAPISVPVNGFKILDNSQLDYSGAKHVAISVLSDNNADITNLRVTPAWAGPGLFYVPTDITTSQTFGVLGGLSGGMTTPVYGPSLKVVLINVGPNPLPIKQVTVYAAASKN